MTRSAELEAAIAALDVAEAACRRPGMTRAEMMVADKVRDRASAAWERALNPCRDIARNAECAQ